MKLKKLRFKKWKTKAPNYFFKPRYKHLPGQVIKLLLDV